MTPILVRFFGVAKGVWRVRRIDTLRGPTLPECSHIAIHEGDAVAPNEHVWQLKGVTSHHRYVERREVEALRAVQAGLGRREATRAALIPIRKSAAWWELAQDERREIFEARSQHVAGTVRFLPAIARRLHHSRDLGEPFDFLTWFEYAPEHEPLFDELVTLLRGTEEWRYVEREIDIRVERS